MHCVSEEVMINYKVIGATPFLGRHSLLAPAMLNPLTSCAGSQPALLLNATVNFGYSQSPTIFCVAVALHLCLLQPQQQQDIASIAEAHRER